MGTQRDNHLKEYILVNTRECKISSYHKQEDGSWQEVVVIGINATLNIHSIEMQLPLMEIYARTIFAEEANNTAADKR